MNGYLIAANVLTGLAFLLHTFQGDREIQLLYPSADAEHFDKKQETWTMTRCGWHWISIDLLLATLLLASFNFSNYWGMEKVVLQLLAFYFAAYGVIWLFLILISPGFRHNYVKLGQWLLLFLIAGLIYGGISV